MRFFSSESRERVLEIVEARFTKTLTTSSSCSKIVILGGESTCYFHDLCFLQPDGEPKILTSLAETVLKFYV